MSEESFDTLDISSLELQLQEKLNELQWKTKALEESQKELLQSRQELLNKDMLLEDKKKSINNLKMHLTTANQVIELIEKEKSKNVNERIQLQIMCDAALKERESLLEQAHSVKLENMTLKLNLHELSETITANKSTIKNLEVSLLEHKEQFSRANNSLRSNLAKLEKEQQLLVKSVESTKKLNQRLQTIGLCAHALCTKKDKEIEELQKELALQREVNNDSLQKHQNGATNVRKTKVHTERILEETHNDIEKSNEADREVDEFLKNYRNMYD